MDLLVALSLVINLGVPGRSNANVSIAARDAFVAVVWSASTAQGTTDIYAAASRDGGATFASPVRVNSTEGDARVNGEQPPRVVLLQRAGGAPSMVVLWTSKGSAGTTLLSARSDDGGKTFSKSALVPDTDAPGNRGWYSAAADGSGSVYAAWLDHREQESKLYVGSIADGLPAKGIAGVVCYCCKTAIATGADDAIFTAWRHVYPGNVRDIAFSMSRDRGKTFAPPIRVSEDRWVLDGCPDDGPAMAIDTAGVAHVAWPSLVDRPEPHKEIFYAWTSDGRPFTPRVRITVAGRNAAHPQIVAHRAGVTVLWDEVVDGRRRVFARRRSRSNRNFAPVELSEPNVGAYYPVAAVVSDTIVAAWVQGSGPDSVIAVRRLPIR